MLMNEIVLPGSGYSSGKTKRCTRCHEDRALEGGVEPRPGKFVCRHCWRLSVVRKKSGNRQNP